MAEQTIDLSVRGIHSYSSELSGVPKGALLEGDNIDVSRLNIAEPARGFNYLEDDLPSPSDRAQQLLAYKSQILAHNGTALLSYSGAAWSSRGSVAAPSGQKIRHAIGNQNLYLTTSLGIYKLDSISGSLSLAGKQKATGLTASLTGSSGFLGISQFTAYVCCFAKVDANNNLIFGGVSQRVVIQNTAGATRNVAIDCQIPQGIAAGDILQVSRVAQLPTEPDQEYQLNYEVILSGADITAGHIAFTDSVPDELLGASLYTATSQGGAQNDHWSLPFAKDLVVYKGHLFAFNIRYRHRLQTTIIAVSGTGLVDGSTFVMTRGATVKTYTAKTSPSLTGEYQLVTSGTASTNIRDTALNLVKKINDDATGFAYAFYISGARDLPGMILIEARDITDTAFTLTSNKEAAYSPNLPATANSQSTSTAVELKNGIAFSDAEESEHMPLRNLLRAGRSDSNILRAKALQDAILIWTEGGIFVLRGEDRFSFSVKELDTTAILLAPEAVCVANNTAFAYLDTGFAACTDNGVNIISVPIKDQLLTLQGLARAEIIATAHAVPYDTDGKVFFFLPENAGDTSAQKAWVYNFFTDNFLPARRPALSGLVFEDKLHLAPPTTNRIQIERKNYDETDFADYGSEVTILTDSGITLELSSVSEMEEGDILIQGDEFAYVEEVDADSDTVTVDIDVEWDILLPVTHLKGIECTVGWNASFAGNPAGFHEWVETILLFKRSYVGKAFIGFSTDQNTGVEEVEIDQSGGTGDFGDFDFGEVTFGGDPEKAPVRCTPPRNSAMSNLLYVRFRTKVAFSDWQLNGLSLLFNNISTSSVP